MPIPHALTMDSYTQRYWLLTLNAQSGIADRSQAQRAGFSRRAMAYRLRSAKWRRMHRGVYATFTGPVDREAKLWAALRRAGPGAMLSHETAAEVHGLVDKPSGKINITVPANRRPAQRAPLRGIVIHRSNRSLPDRLPEWKLPRTRIEDTVLDLVAAARSFDEAYGWISRATSQRFVTADMLREAMARRKRVRWRAWLNDALADAEEGAYFPLERRYARDVERAHGLPPGTPSGAPDNRRQNPLQGQLVCRVWRLRGTRRADIPPERAGAAGQAPRQPQPRR